MAELKSFLDCLGDLHTRGAKDARNSEWGVWDPNGNGYLSLAECDGALQKKLLGTTGDDTVWKRFRPSYIRAFNDAKDAASSKTSRSDDYVTKVEFRLLFSYLRI